MALVGYDDSGATIDSTMESLLWGAAIDKSPVRKVRGWLPERCELREVGTELIRSIARSSP